MNKKAKIEIFDLYKNNQYRKLFIHKGKEFDSSKEKIIFLLHDAQNFFEEKYASINISWKLVETLEKLKIQNYLAFGLSCLPWLLRMVEYSPFELREELQKDPNYKKLKSIKPGGAKYLDAIFQNLIPYVEKEYSFSFAKAKIIMIGSSMGGLITTYCAQQTPKLVDGYIVFSNALYANAPQAFEFFSGKCNLNNYYHYMGGKENSGNISSQEEYLKTYHFLEKWLSDQQVNYASSFNPEGKHNEIAWQKELRQSIVWVLQNINKPKKE